MDYELFQDHAYHSCFACNSTGYDLARNKGVGFDSDQNILSSIEERIEPCSCCLSQMICPVCSSKLPGHDPNAAHCSTCGYQASVGKIRLIRIYGD